VNDIWVVNASPVIALGLRAKKKAIISSAADVLELLCAAGFRLDSRMIRAALEGIGETWGQET
jgi:hypothetical protein